MRAYLSFALTVGALTGVAQAHTRLVSASPMPNASLRLAPSQISIGFNEAVLPRFVTLTVTAPDGKKLHVASLTVDPQTRKRVSAIVRGGGQPGAYRVDWSAAGTDMHRMTGSYRFTVRP